jgi:UDP-GlcNAc:undecaprenyl-phosphate GlcNAc-1-phosphate transferase
MNNIYIFLLYFILLFFLMAIYFKLADKYNIIDKPNERSSHTLITVRGGGIIFPFSAIIYSSCFGFQYSYFIVGLILISLVSFIDDLRELNGNIRMIFQFISVGLIFLEFGLFLSIPLYYSLPLIVFTVAMINAWNFMDGINGITGGYSLLTIVSLIYLNDKVVEFNSTGFMIAIALSLLVFIFYNFRTHARCFAGDVGSISIAFILAFLMIKLLITSGNLNYILFLLLYGLDTVSTVFFRVIRKESILQPHRSHLFQFLANEKGLSHNTVSLIYICIQLIINLAIVLLIPENYISFVICLVISLLLFLGLRFKLEGRKRLLTNQ